MKFKKNIIVLLHVFCFLFTTSCTLKNNTSDKIITIKESDITKKTITVNGMTCVGCEVTLEETISKIEGVVTVKASHTNNNVHIEFDSTKTNIYNIKKSIKKSGYKTFGK